jgi:hypothetical protein
MKRQTRQPKADAIRYLEAVDHAGVRHINGDVILADSTNRALGQGSLDLDTIIWEREEAVLADG